VIVGVIAADVIELVATRRQALAFDPRASNPRASSH
jgi:hypothetical protein